MTTVHFVRGCCCIVAMCVFSFCSKNKAGHEQAGKTTFFCKINGEKFVPGDAVTIPLQKGLSVYFSEDSLYLQLSATEPRRDSDNRKRGLYLDVSGLHVGEQPFGEYAVGEVGISATDVSEWYVADKSWSGKIDIITLDTVNNIISGTFFFDGEPRFSSDKTVSVTEGKFDIHYTD